jgi:hypothetical protein
VRRRGRVADPIAVCASVSATSCALWLNVIDRMAPPDAVSRVHVHDTLLPIHFVGTHAANSTIQSTALVAVAVVNANGVAAMVTVHVAVAHGASVFNRHHAPRPLSVPVPPRLFSEPWTALPMACCVASG